MPPASIHPQIGDPAVVRAIELRTYAPRHDRARVDTLDYGAFVWSPGSTASDNGTTVVKVSDITTGRWIAIAVQALDTEVAALVASQNLSLGVPDAADTDGVHASYDGDEAEADFPGPFTDPDVPRNVTVTFGDGWDGGDVTVVGTDQFGAAVSEVIEDSNDATVAGVKIFATVTAATKEAEGVANVGATIGHGDKLGIPATLADDVGVLLVDGVAEAGTFDDTYHAVTPTTVADGAVEFVVSVNINPAAS